MEKAKLDMLESVRSTPASPYAAVLKRKHFKTLGLLVATSSLDESCFTTSVGTSLLMFKWVRIVLHA